MKALVHAGLRGAVLGLAVGAAFAQLPLNNTHTYTVTGETCLTKGGSGGGQACGNCCTSVATAVTSVCASGQQCIGFQCTSNPTITFTACSEDGATGNCTMDTTTSISGCLGCANYFGNPASCVTDGTCRSPGCGAGTTEDPVPGPPVPACQ